MTANPTPNPTSNPTLPTRAEASELTVMLSIGFGNTCAHGYGRIKCWGQGSRYKLGNGDTDDLWSPPDATIDLGNFTVKNVGVGTDHVCATSTNFTVKCWGMFTFLKCNFKSHPQT